jgi:hypothetical protein
MITIQLKRSGGQLGKTLQATHQVDMDEEEIIKKLKAVTPVSNPQARDDFYYSIIVNRKKTFPIDRTLLKGKLKKIVEELEDDLKVDGE